MSIYFFTEAKKYKHHLALKLKRTSPWQLCNSCWQWLLSFWLIVIPAKIMKVVIVMIFLLQDHHVCLEWSVICLSSNGLGQDNNIFIHNRLNNWIPKSMAWCKIDVTPKHMHWSYISFVLGHGNSQMKPFSIQSHFQLSHLFKKL